MYCVSPISQRGLEELGAKKVERRSCIVTGGIKVIVRARLSHTLNGYTSNACSWKDKDPEGVLLITVYPESG
jgi:hypothetical protein